MSPNLILTDCNASRFGYVGENVTIVLPFWVQGNPAFVKIHDDVWMSGCVFLLANDVIDIGARTQIGPGVHIYTGTHGLLASERSNITNAPVYIGEDCWIGGCAVILCGVSIGPRTTVGAGSVVTRDVPSDVLVTGSPARVVRSLA